MLAEKTGNPKAGILGRTLDAATGALLEAGHSPSRRVGELDNRGSHYWLARYWARELAEQDEDAELAEAFGPLAERLERDEQSILDELNGVQGDAVDLGGYYHVDRDKATKVMRPSATLNEAIDAR